MVSNRRSTGKRSKRVARSPQLVREPVARERTVSEIVREQLQGFPDRPRPDQVTLYSGLCEGGPSHGLPLHHGTPVFRVFRNRETWRTVTRSQEAPADDEVRVDEYRHENGRWIFAEG